MARIVNVRVDSNVNDVMAEVNKKILVALAQCGEVIEGHAKGDCPVDTGLLRNSLTYAVSGNPTNISGYRADNPKEGRASSGSYSGVVGSVDDPIVYVGTNVEYAPWVEFKSMAHEIGKAHFLRDAGQNHVSELKEVTEKILSTL
jgi:hypothetical protein